jgi:hypothetical protein
MDNSEAIQDWPSKPTHNTAALLIFHGAILCDNMSFLKARPLRKPVSGSLGVASNRLASCPQEE